MHLKRVSKSGFGPFAFDEWRYLPDGSDNPDFNLINLNIMVRQFSLLENFGCGSSREHAAWALKDYGFNIIIAGSFSDIFYMNCTKNAMLPICLNQKEREHLAQFDEITVDLPNQTVSTVSQSFHFDIDETWKNKLIHGLDDIAITLQFENLIEKYEKLFKGVKDSDSKN